MKHGKKYSDGAKLIDRNTLYESADALDLAVQTAKAKFDETIEVHVRLGVDSRHADQQVRGAVVLPNGTGKDVRVAVFAKGDLAKAAEAAGADVVGDADLVQKIQSGWMEFDVAIASPDMMGFVGRLGKVLGPRGLMPSPKAGTVTTDVAKAVTEAKAGRSNTVLINPILFTARSARLLSARRNCLKTSTRFLTRSLRRSPPLQKVSTSDPVQLLQRWAPAFVSTPIRLALPLLNNFLLGIDKGTVLVLKYFRCSTKDSRCRKA